MPTWNEPALQPARRIRVSVQAKAVLQLAKDNLVYYDQVLDISRTRFSAGDIAQIDLDRLELQRVQYESDLQTAEKIWRTQRSSCSRC